MSVTESAPRHEATCRGCDELLLAEAVAKGERDHSRATDCRVLLKLHQKSGECRAGEQG
ncbi:hypothetical protein ACRWOO_33470 [Streptomyces sp. NEAU-PBA10]|uniref:hypothetical protein n=1 Tax=unclassified Streptomyces TaxID=2593676 RepID=UPI000A8F5D2A|nr:MULTISPECIES: hypothetical protein [unclassified Streptomyces]MCG5121621.1 hypothetical protein [Streptomyces sp. T7(2022)]